MASEGSSAKKILIPLLIILGLAIFIYFFFISGETSIGRKEVFVITNEDLPDISKRQKIANKNINLEKNYKYSFSIDSIVCPIKNDTRFRLRLGLAFYSDQIDLKKEVEFKKDDISKIVLILLENKEKHQIKLPDIRTEIYKKISMVLTKGALSRLEITDFKLVQIKE